MLARNSFKDETPVDDRGDDKLSSSDSSLLKANCQKRREGDSNACPHCRNDIISQQLTNNNKSLGVSGECVEGNDCRSMTEIDPSLKKIIHAWDTLPEPIRKAVETICLSPIT